MDTMSLQTEDNGDNLLHERKVAFAKKKKSDRRAHQLGMTDYA